MSLPVYRLNQPEGRADLTIPAAIVKDSRLGFAPLGALVRLLAVNAAGLNINNALARHKPDKALRALLKKLVSCGYLDEVQSPGKLALAGATTSRPAAKDAAAKRGSRLPPEWWPDPCLMAWATTTYPFLDVRLETAKFVDYWTEVPGWRGRKLSWDGTWRNWIRKAAAASAGGPTRLGQPAHSSKTMIAMENLNDLSRQVHERADQRALPDMDH